MTPTAVLPEVVHTPPPAAAPKPGAARTRLLLEGPIIRTLLRLGAPNVIVNVVLIAVTATVDAHFVGRLGPSALAGLALVFPLLMLMQQTANSSMGGAMASAVARALGAGRRDDAASLVVHALVIAGGMAAIFTAVVLALGPTFYRVMGGRGAALTAAVEYSTVIFAGALVYWLLSTLTSIVRGAGQAAVLGGVYLGAELLHVALVPALVFGVGPVPALGVAGAAVATVASFTASTLVLAWYLASGRTAIAPAFRGVRLERRLFKEILRVGGPMSLQPLFGNLTLATLTGYVGTLGPTALAAFGIAARLEYVLNPLAFGLGAGVLAMVGTNLGAGQLARATRISWTAATLAMTGTGVIGLVALLFPDVWITVFSADPAVHAAAMTYLRIAGIAYAFQGLGLTLSSAFQAAARPRWPLLAIAGRCAFVMVGGWLVIHFVGGGLVGLAVIGAGGLFVYGATLALRFRRGPWRPVRGVGDR